MLNYFNMVYYWTAQTGSMGVRIVGATVCISGEVNGARDAQTFRNVPAADLTTLRNLCAAYGVSRKESNHVAV
jgi:hypothetical protein